MPPRYTACMSERKGDDMFIREAAPSHPPSNGLRRLAGKWTREEFETFEKAVAETCEHVDDEASS